MHLSTPTRASRRRFLAALPALAVIGASRSEAAALTDDDVAKLLLPVRDKHKIPALAGAVITARGVAAKGAVGVRKAGAEVAVTVDDLWHLGSNTKAMTATLAALAVEAGKLRWESTLAEVFPACAGLKESPFAAVTLTHLLAHRAGLPHDIRWRDMKDRDEVVKAVAALKPVFPPGETFEYSNVGYALAGHMVENALGGTWENLMRERIFKPLGMAHAGFGGTGTIGQIDQPWPHLPNGNPARTNGAAMDNPPVMGPAGIVHASLDDWARFVADHLAGAAGHGALLKPETYRHLHTPSFGGTYAFGWKVTTRPWGGGAVLTHGGSNTMNKSAAWLAPLKGFAVIACANQGGEVTTKACDDASAAMIRAHNQS
ncbi:MAG: beta-lactamase family protein [Verrucomicrobiaceae bacterium]|nr:beta-lactamase family protein [Verrucomicrobiaceae bacterium]